MRKYTQLGLVIICLVSVILLMVMERRYSNMKVFLEVADIFQTSDAKIKCLQQIEDLKKTLEGEYLELTHKVDPIWKQVESSTFLYSAFYSLPEVKVTTLGVTDSPPEKCRIWLDSTTFLDTQAQVVTLTILGKLTAVAIECINSNYTAIPVAVELYGTKIPVEEQKLTTFDQVALCTTPVDITLSDVRLAEFLTYHNNIGVSQFYLYDESLSAKVKTFARRAPFIQSTLTVFLLPWNVPSTIEQIAGSILKADCLLRSGITAKFVGILSLEEFFVLRRPSANLTSFLTTVLSETAVLGVHERYFCDEYPDDVIGAALDYPFVTQRKVKYTKYNKNHRMVFTSAGSLTRFKSLALSSRVSESENTALVNEDGCNLNVYTSCGKLPFWTKRSNVAPRSSDSYLSKFHEVLFGSKLYKHTQNMKSVVYNLIV